MPRAPAGTKRARAATLRALHGGRCDERSRSARGPHLLPRLRARLRAGRAVEGETLVALRPIASIPSRSGFACNKGIAGVDIHHDPDRLDHPLRRVQRRLRAGELGRRDRRRSPRSCAASSSAHGPERGRVLHRQPERVQHARAGRRVGAFFAQLGSAARVGSRSGTQDCANKFAGSEAVFGSSTIHPIPDLDHTEFLLVLGANPRVSHG